MWDYNKRFNIHVIGVPGGVENKGGSEKVLKEIMAKIVPHMAYDINLQIQEVEWPLNRVTKTHCI